MDGRGRDSDGTTHQPGPRAFRLIGTLFVLGLLVAQAGCAGCNENPGSADASGDAAASADAAPEDKASSQDTGQEPDPVVHPTCVPKDYAFTQPDCSSNDAPSRCDDSRADFDAWGPASVMFKATLTDGDCCASVDRDDSLDNTYGQLVDLAEFAGPPADDIFQQEILRDRLIYLLEATDLDSLHESGETPIQIYQARPSTSEAEDFVVRRNDALESTDGLPFTIRETTLADGVQSKGWIPNATLEEGTLTASRGRLWLGDVPRSLYMVPKAIHIVDFRAEIDRSRTDISSGEGIHLKSAHLAGFLYSHELVDAINDELANCDCLGNPSNVLTYEPVTDEDPDDPDFKEPTIHKDKLPKNPKQACNQSASPVCQNPETLAALAQQMGQMSDIDTDCDGTMDAMSFGMRFGAAGATIDGVEIP